MTLDEAIKHAEEVAEENEKRANWFWAKEGNPNYENRVECAEEHRQLAEWLKELKAYREQGNALMDGILKIIHSTIYDFMDVCDDDESPLTDKDKLLLNINKAICNNLKSLHEQFEKNIREFEVK